MQQDTIQQEELPADEMLPGTSLLHGQYVLERHLVSGGFGITYLARDSLDRQVVIKECFPSSICCRFDDKVQARSVPHQSQFASVLRHFLREARRLSKLSHPNIVGVHQVFEENNTAYMALDFVDGMDLFTILEEDRERLTRSVIKSILVKSLEAVRYIHDQGILHRDISPDNLLLDRDNNVTLIDFGAAREQATKENRALSALLAVKDGYSPHEFYLGNIAQCPSCDLYSLGATFYHVITGQAPPQSQERLAAIAAGDDDPYEPLAKMDIDLDQALLFTIDNALEVLPENRIQTAQDWITAIETGVIDQMPSSRPRFDSEVQVAISKLVEDTNRDIDPDSGPLADGKSGKRRGGAEAEVDQPAEPVQPVDIFGNPIEDVNAWLKSQDRQARKQEKAERKLKARSKDRPASSDNTGGDPPRTPLVRSLFGRLTPFSTPKRSQA